MADASDRLMDLEPVTFHYKQASAGGSRDLQYGLIAEQVAAIYPELAVYDKEGRVETLQYQQLPAMLLNEIQKQHKTIDDLETRIAKLEQLLRPMPVAPRPRPDIDSGSEVRFESGLGPAKIALRALSSAVRAVDS